jgi:excisionase family DNA binding protein
MPRTAATPPVRLHHLVTVDQAAEYVGVSSKTVRRWIQQGTLTGYAAGPRLIRVDLEEVNAMLVGGR